MRTGLLTAAVLLTSASAALAVEPIELEQVASGFTAPIHLEEPNDGTGRLFLVDQVGTIWIIMPDGTVLDVNPTYTNVLGYSREELIGKSSAVLRIDEGGEATFHFDVE